MNVTLNTGAKMPSIGLGTSNGFRLGEVGPAVEAALREGYRLIDCAHFYGNEAEIGEALQKCFKEGVVKREDVFIISKLWCDCKEPEDVIPSCELSLKNLQLDYVDLYLVHWPLQLAKDTSFPIEDEDKKMGYNSDTEAKCWERMEECLQRGLTKSIGISNFSITKTEQLLKTAKIVPAVNQVECHLHFQQPKLKEYCDRKRIIMQCYFPLGGTGRDKLFEDSVIVAIAAKHNATAAQVCLAYGMQHGCSVIPKSINATRIAENFKSVELKLDEEDMKRLHASDKNTRFLPGNHILKAGVESAEVLWDTTADREFKIN